MPKLIELPDSISTHADTIAACMREALNESGHNEIDITVIKPNARHGLPTDILPSVALVVNGRLVWLTKKWVDTYLWPRIQQRIDAPTIRFLDWLLPETRKSDQ